jgi:hypothetical protein
VSDQTDGAVKDEKRGAKGTVRGKLYDPLDLFVIGLDGGLLGISTEEEARVNALPEAERLPAFAPYRIAWAKDQFPDDKTAHAMIDALVDDRATQPLDPGFHASCQGGVNEPVIATDIGTMKDGSPMVAMIEGRQRDRSLRIHNTDRLSEKLPPYSLSVILKTNLSPKKAREIRVVTGNHVALTPLQRAERAQEMIDSGVAPVDVAPIVGCLSKKALSNLLDLLKTDAGVQEAIASGGVTLGAAREMAHLPPEEQRARAKVITEQNLKGRRASEIARTGRTSTSKKTAAPPRAVVAAIGKRLCGSNDPLLHVVGAILVWADSGVDAGLEKIPGLREIITEQIVKNQGLPIPEVDRERLRALMESIGSEDQAAAKLGINKTSLVRAVAGMKLKTRVRGAILAALKPEEQKAA